MTALTMKRIGAGLLAVAAIVASLPAWYALAAASAYVLRGSVWAPALGQQLVLFVGAFVSLALAVILSNIAAASWPKGDSPSVRALAECAALRRTEAELRDRLATMERETAERQAAFDLFNEQRKAYGLTAISWATWAKEKARR